MSQKTIPTFHPLLSLRPINLSFPTPQSCRWRIQRALSQNKPHHFLVNDFILPGHTVTAAGEASARPDVCRAASSVEDASPRVRGQGTWHHALEVLAAHGRLEHRHVLSGWCRRAFSRFFRRLPIIFFVFDENKLPAPLSLKIEGVRGAFFFTALVFQLKDEAS